MELFDLRKIIMNNIWLKLISLVLAIGSWIYITDLVSKEVTFRVPVKIDLSEKMIPITNNVEYINLTVKGPAGILDTLTPKSFRIYKDLTDVFQTGNIIVPVQDMNISVPNHVSVEKFFPKRITINLDRIIEKDFKVNVITRGKPAPGYVELKNHIVNPPTIVLRAPAQLAENIDTVNTDPIDISGLISTRRFPNVRLQELLPRHPLNEDKTVEITIMIGEEQARRTFAKIPIRIMELVKTPYAMKMSVREAEVTLNGKREVLDVSDATDIKVFIDVANLEPGVYDLPIEGRISDQLLLKGVTVAEIKPSSVEVTVEVKP